MGGQQHGGGGQHFLSHQQFLLVASRQGMDFDIHSRCSNIERLHHLFSPAPGAVAVHQQSPRERPTALMSQHGVFPQGRFQQKTPAMAIGGNQAHAGLAPVEGRQGVDLLAVEADPAGVDRADSHQDLHQFPLAVSLHSGYSQHLPPPDPECHVLDHPSVPVFGPRTQSLCLQ